MKVFKEFREFAIKGNLIDMAVAFVMGGAFGKVVSSFIGGIVMPLIGKVTTGVDFSGLKYVLTPKVVDEKGVVVVEEASVKYGEFITVMIDFLVVAFVIFLVVKAINRMKRKMEEAPAPTAPPEPTTQEKLLTEIRDLLKK